MDWISDLRRSLMRKTLLFTIPFLMLSLSSCADQTTAPEMDLTASFKKPPKPPEPPPPSGDPANPRIAYSDDGLWVADEDGANKTLIYDPDLGGWNVQPAWSPLGDGTEGNPYWIFFTTTGWQHNVARVSFYYEDGNLQVSPIQELAPDDYWTGVAVSPDGGSLAVTRIGGTASVLVTNTDFSGSQIVYETGPDGLVRNPTWSGDGTKVAFVEEGGVAVLKVVDVGDPAFPVVKELDLTSGSMENLSWARQSNSLVYDLDGTMYLLELDEDLNLLNGPESIGSGRGPVWSHDDTRVLYYNRRFYLKNLVDGGRDKRLPMGGRWQDWRSDPL
jgi:hypothetical protein